MSDGHGCHWALLLEISMLVVLTLGTCIDGNAVAQPHHEDESQSTRLTNVWLFPGSSSRIPIDRPSSLKWAFRRLDRLTPSLNHCVLETQSGGDRMKEYTVIVGIPEQVRNRNVNVSERGDGHLVVATRRWRIATCWPRSSVSTFVVVVALLYFLSSEEKNVLCERDSFLLSPSKSRT